MKDKEWRRSRRRCIDVTFINILTRCFRRAQNSFLSAILDHERSSWLARVDVRSCFTERQREGDQCCIYRKETTLQSLSFSVSQGCEVCSIKAAPTSRESDVHFTAASPNGRLRAWVMAVAVSRWMTYTLCVHSTPPFAPFHVISGISGFALSPPSTEENSIRADLSVYTNLPPHFSDILEGHATWFLMLLFVLLHNNIWPKSADIFIILVHQISLQEIPVGAEIIEYDLKKEKENTHCLWLKFSNYDSSLSCHWKE